MFVLADGNGNCFGGKIVKSFRIISLILIACIMSRVPNANGETASAAAEKDLSPEEIIVKFSEKETESYKAWMGYTYVQNAYIRVLSVDGKPVNEWMELVFEVVFKDDGSREVKQVRRKGQLQSVRFSLEDMEIITSLNPFALTTADLPLYDLKYNGKERVDELDCYVFSVKPKNIKRGQLYFEGKIWVDDVDFVIVRTLGRAVPQSSNNLFPEFETLRQLVNEQHWFPVWTYADERLRFPNTTVRIEQTITYDEYKKFDAKTTIRYETPGIEDESK